MADISVRNGYQGVATSVSEAVSHPCEALSDQIFTYLSLSGAIAGGLMSLRVESPYPAATGILCTVLGCASGVSSWFLGSKFWNATHPHHN